VLGILQDEYRRTLAALDLRRSRQLLVDAAGDGYSLGRLYVGVVRPALARTWDDRGASAAGRLLFDSAEAALGVVAARPVEGASMRGEGRHALVSVGADRLDALDGRIIADTLCADGWTVATVEAGTAASAVVELARDRHVQLVVMPTSDPADLLLSAQTYTLLRRMADPPVIVACALGRAGEARRACAIGADAFVEDPDALLDCVTRRLPAAGVRNWGVRLRRLGGTLVIAPTGDLDARSVERLRQVVDSRTASFDALVIDTRDVASVHVSGLQAVVAWLREATGAGASHRLLPGRLMDEALSGSPLDAAWLAEPLEAG
jgi:CheY-like chemotaxis protein